MREITDKEYQEINQSFSIKAEYQKKAGKNVSPERFLFCCYEVSKHLKEHDHNFANRLLWEGFEQDLTGSNVKEKIAELVAWYKDNRPHLTKTKPVDFDSMWHVCVEISHLEKDFAALVNKLTDEVIEDHLLDTDELTGIWLYLKESLFENLPALAEQTWQYFTWVYGISPPAVEVNLSEVPPVGRFARRGGGNSRSNDRSSNNRNPRNAGGQRNKDRNSSGRQNGRPRDNRPGDNRSRDNKGRKNFKNNKGQGDKAKEQEVIALVDAAIQKLSKSDVGELSLAPQNSFFRRIQHKHAVDAGYETESIGEGKDRAVKIFSK